MLGDGLFRRLQPGVFEPITQIVDALLLRETRFQQRIGAGPALVLVGDLTQRQHVAARPGVGADAHLFQIGLKVIQGLAETGGIIDLGVTEGLDRALRILNRDLHARAEDRDVVPLHHLADHRRHQPLEAQPGPFHRRLVQLLRGEDRAALFDCAITPHPALLQHQPACVIGLGHGIHQPVAIRVAPRPQHRRHQQHRTQAPTPDIELRRGRQQHEIRDRDLALDRLRLPLHPPRHRLQSAQDPHRVAVTPHLPHARPRHRAADHQGFQHDGLVARRQCISSDGQLLDQHLFALSVFGQLRRRRGHGQQGRTQHCTASIHGSFACENGTRMLVADSNVADIRLVTAFIDDSAQNSSPCGEGGRGGTKRDTSRSSASRPRLRLNFRQATAKRWRSRSA